MPQKGGQMGQNGPSSRLQLPEVGGLLRSFQKSLCSRNKNLNALSNTFLARNNSMWYNLQWDELNVETIQYFEDLERSKFFRDALI